MSTTSVRTDAHLPDPAASLAGHPDHPYPLRLLVCLPAATDPDHRAAAEAIRRRLQPFGVAVPQDIPARLGHDLMPVGSHALADAETRQRARAARHARYWAMVVAGTAAARPWSHFLDRHHTDPKRHPLARVAAAFAAQPRIAVLAARIRDRAAADLYGPGLEALQAGTGCFARYRAGVAIFGDALLTRDGRLLAPSHTPRLVEQTLHERQAYHHAAREHLTTALAHSRLVVIRCLRYPSAIPPRPLAR